MGVKCLEYLREGGGGGGGEREREYTFKYNATILLQTDYIPLNNLVTKISENSQLSFSFSDPLFCT